ncbi:MAG: DNA mismatch repair protein MutS [Planctomycetota bacterium]
MIQPEHNLTISSDATPMMRQYLEAKRKHPSELLMFRMGDFYEFFYEDARIGAEILGIALTARSKDRSGERIPMAGIPVRALNTYLRKLLEAGQRVAICDQLQDPAAAKGIIERDVVQVVTPGTFLDEGNLDDQRPLHLVALGSAPATRSSPPNFGLSWVDLSTGKFHAEDFATAAATEEALLRIGPAECIYAEGLRRPDCAPLAWLERANARCALTPFPEWHFDRATARERLLQHFGTRTLEGFGCEHLTAGLSAAGALIHYLRETQRQALPHILRLVPGASTRTMRLDAATYRALDLVEVARTGARAGSLLAHLDRSRTAMGARQLREWLCAPLVERTAILTRQGAVAALERDAETAAVLTAALGEVRDIARLSARLPLGRVNGRDLRSLAGSLRAMPTIHTALDGCENQLLVDVRAALDLARLAAITELIERAITEEPPITIKEGGVIRDGYEPELDELRAIGRDGMSWIARFQQDEIARTGIPNLKVAYNRVFGYYLEVTQSHASKVPSDYVRKQTVKGAERYVTQHLKEQEQRVLGARERAEKLELELFQQVRTRIQEDLEPLQRAGDALGALDACLALATVAREESYVAPEIVEEPVLEVEEGRHPVLAAVRGPAATNFTPNDISLGGEHGTLAIITGPNMAGKSTYIRQAALITLLAQVGSFVPARRARVGIADRIFTRVGAADDIASGQSTFMVEMIETACILNNATARSLVVLDEVGRGTSTLDGVSLAWATAEYLLADSHSRTLFATHYHELTELETRFPAAARNLNVVVREWQDQIVFLHKIVPGGTDKAYGIHVARLAGIPERVLARAREILSQLELEHGRARSIPEPPSTSSTPTGGAKKPQQLDLFSSGYEDLDRKLRALDILRTTPMDALRFLDELKSLLP